MSAESVASTDTTPAPSNTLTLSFALPGTKFEIPLPRPELLERTALVDRLVAAREEIISVIAPPGYGKTTLLAQWARRFLPYVAWVTCDESDNDPVVLLSAIAAALSAVQLIEPDVFGSLAMSGAGITFVRRFVASIRAVEAPVAVVLDHSEAVTNPECRRMIAEFALRLPAGWRLALASRTEPPLPSARLRVEGRLAEVGTTDLALSRPEATALLDRSGVDMARIPVDELLEQTEGWPAGLYLGALAVRAGAAEMRMRFTGEDRFISDYLRTELLSDLSKADRQFLVRTSMLDSMSGPLCDAVLKTRASGRRLEQLETRNLLVIPLDRRREWYRYHHLLREMLQAELRRTQPDLIAVLHHRAADWYEANGMPEAAIAAAEAASDFDRAARLILQVAQPTWASGRVETVLHWMESLRDRTDVEHYGAIAAHGSLIFALLGRPGEAERWAEAAEHAPPRTGVLPDGNTMESTLAYLRANLFRFTPETARADAHRALEGLGPDSPYRATMVFTEGLALLLDAQLDEADQRLAHAYEIACAAHAVPFSALILAERCIICAARHDWSEVTTLSRRALGIVMDGRFDEYWTSALVFAWAARAAIHSADVAAGRGYLARAVRLRPLLTYALPVVSVQTLLEMAHCYIALGDPAGAGAVLAQAQGILEQRPNLGSLAESALELRLALARLAHAPAGASALTAAELRLLPLLATHLSLREIGNHLFVSTHTVKSHTHSIYQKLGVSSRSAAVAQTRALGLADL